MDVLSLTQDLIKFETINPPGNEEELALFVGGILQENGFEVDYPRHAKNRLNMIANKGLSTQYPPIVLTGHLDVVPLGAADWTYNPMQGTVEGDKLYGRGATDMKGGVAAMIIAAIRVSEKKAPRGGIKLILTADEELGCHGAKKMCISGYAIGKASAIVVGEPTSNFPYIGHKGGLYINAVTTGVTAHSSMPHLGDNAIYKAAKAINKIATHVFDVQQDQLLGYPTINVGKVSGGLNLNSVPDHTEFTIDVRSTTKLKNSEAYGQLKEKLGADVVLSKMVNLEAISTPEAHPFVRMVFDLMDISPGRKGLNKSVPFLTDASVLTPWMDDAPTIILGPGEPDMAHKTDEFCYIDKLHRAVSIYQEIIIKNAELNR